MNVNKTYCWNQNKYKPHKKEPTKLRKVINLIKEYGDSTS